MGSLPDSSKGEVLAVHVSRTFTVSSCSTNNILLVLNESDKVHGTFRIFRAYGYGDKELKFRVLDKTETSQLVQPVLLDLGMVANDASFDFTATRSGDYVLVFDNEPSSSSSNSRKEILLTYEITNFAVTYRQDAMPIA